MTQVTCSICGKEGPGHRGMCNKHYLRWLRHGDPLYAPVIIGDDRARHESYVDRSGGPDACHPWTGFVSADGYGHLHVKDKVKLAHKFGWELDNDPLPPGVELDHECHNRAVRAGTCGPGVCLHRRCCNSRHLVPRGTRAEHREATAQWEMLRGSSNPSAKLDGDAVREIKALLAAGAMPQHEIARQYDVTQAAISLINTGKKWSHIT